MLEIKDDCSFCHQGLTKHDKDFMKCDILDVFKFRLIYIHQLSIGQLVISWFDFS